QHKAIPFLATPAELGPNAKAKLPGPPARTSKLREPGWCPQSASALVRHAQSTMSAFLSDSTFLRLQSIGRSTINRTKNEKVMVLGKWFLQAAHLSRTTS